MGEEGAGAVGHVGRLLVATPLIGDPNFERSVVFVLAHGSDGAFGVVINRPSAAPVAVVDDAWETQVDPPAVVFVGGPVGGDAVLGLARGQGHPPAALGLVAGDVATIDLHRPPDVGERPRGGARLFAGSAGWAPGQLEDELAEGVWWLVDGSADDVFTADPANLWTEVLRRQQGQLAWYANHPFDPTAN